MPYAMRRSTVISWVPAAILLVIITMTAAGVSLMPKAHAASSSSVSVTGSVTGSINFTASCGAVAFGAAFTNGGAGQITPDCVMSFDTNQVTGGAVSVQDNDGAAPFFCTPGPVCNVTATPNAFENAPAGPVKIDATAGADDRFGFVLKSVAGGGGPAGDVTVDAAPALANSSWYPLGTAAAQICHAATNTVGTSCTVAFGGEPGSPQNSGAYSGTALFTAVTT